MTRGSAVAAVALALVVPACTLTDEDERRGRANVVVSEAEGSVLGIRLGSHERRIRRVLGKPVAGDGYFPLGEHYRGPVAIPSPGPGLVLRYDDFAFLLSGERVFSFMVTREGAKTSRGVAIGDDLDEVRRTYDAVRCGEAPAGETLFGGTSTYPWCRARVGRNAVFFGDDPVASITVTRVA